MVELGSLTDAVGSGDQHAARRETQAAIEAGIEPQTILDAMVAGMHDIGERFQRGDAYVPEMLIAARAMKGSMPLLEPLLLEAGLEPEHTVLIGTVEGDLHDIGKNLVALMWRGANARVIDLGVNVTPRAFVEAVEEHAPAAVGLSALLTTTMPAMEKTVGAIRSSATNAPEILIGGAPITANFAEQIGADEFAPDAGAAVNALRELLGS
jgi:5-methyltetrahydrofolate--homocysteine methyltransferase